jgi:hypothetical protein
LITLHDHTDPAQSPRHLLPVDGCGQHQQQAGAIHLRDRGVATPVNIKKSSHARPFQP